jgi:tetratricopeptide (TPR) repeat protein
MQNYYFCAALTGNILKKDYFCGSFSKSTKTPEMAKKNVKQADKNLEGIEQALTRSEQFIEDNQKILTYILGGLLVILLIVVGGKRYYLNPRNEEAASEMFYAERFFENDSFNLALNGYGTYPGFLSIMEDYGLTKTAKVARYYAGICYHQLGQQEEAVRYLEKFRTDDLLVGAAKYSTMGDAYVELGEMDKAATAYKSGIEKYENNFSSPVMLKKLGILYEEMGKLDNALEAYRTIESRYPESQEGREIKKYIGRAESKMTL